jgi:pyrroloquinoline quinone (PQQ) biosynthesis protein C
MELAEFKEALLDVMERKAHWAWPLFTSGRVPKSRLHIHLEQEYAVYIRDFSVLIGRAFVQCPIPAVRRELAENLFEEETGKLSRGRPHAELFLEYPRGLGMDLQRFEHPELLPGSAAYRRALDKATLEDGWEVATAVATIFVEGTKYERGELDASSPKRPEPPLSEHPLVKHYGLPVESLALTQVHREVEGDHRASAWHIVLEHVPHDARQRVVDGMQRILEHWLTYRDGVARACGVSRAQLES